MRGTIRPARCKDNTNKWQITIDTPKVGNKRHQHTERFDGTYDEAEVRLAQLFYEMGSGRYVQPSRKTLATHLDEWLDHASVLKLTPRSAHEYKRIIELHIKPNLGHIQLQKLTVNDVNEFVANLVRNGGVKGRLSSSTIAKIHAVLSSALDNAVKAGLIQRNPCDLSDKPSVMRPRVSVLNEEQTVRLIAMAKGSELYLPVLIAATTGMRRGEILALTWEDIDFERGVINVAHAVSEVERNVIVKGPKSRAGERQISIPKLLMEELLSRRGEGKVCDVKPSTFSTQFARWMRRVGGKRVTFHGLRHSHFSQLIKHGVTPKEVQERAGHATATFTLNVYAHAYDDGVAKTVDEMLAMK